MKKMNIIILTSCISAFLTLTNGCNNKNFSIENDKLLIAEINQIISQWHSSAAASDHAAYIGAMATDGVYIGTDATEHWSTKEFSDWSKPYFDQKKGWNLVSLNRHIYLGINNETAWFDELLDTRMGLCRGSGVVQKMDGKWKICHYVLSATVPNDLIKEVKTLKFPEDSLMVRGLKPATNR